MAKKSISECAVCAKSFYRPKSQAGNFCGIGCYRVAQRRGDYKRGRKITGACSRCGVTVYGRAFSTRRNGVQSDVLFCGRACYDASRTAVIEARRKQCGHCGSSFVPMGANRRFCSWECTRLGRKPKARSCKNCGVLFTPVSWRGKYLIVKDSVHICSDACTTAWRTNDAGRREKISAAFTGPKHPNWQGGSHFYSYRGAGWQRICREVIRRAKEKCEHCGMTQEDHRARFRQRLHVNHKIPFHQPQPKALSANDWRNLEALCVSCHMKADWRWRKEHPVQLTLGSAWYQSSGLKRGRKSSTSRSKPIAVSLPAE